MPPQVSSGTVAAMTTLNPAPSDLLPAGDELDNMLELSGQIIEVTEFYLSLLTVQPALACPRCGGSAAAPADLTRAQEEQITSDLLTYLCAVAQIDDVIDWDPTELFDPARQAQVDQIVTAAGMEPLPAIAVLAEVVADAIERSGDDQLLEAWHDRWPGSLIPDAQCDCPR